MKLKKHQIKSCNLLLKERIINSRIEERIFQNKKIKSIESFCNGLIKRKNRFLELYEVAKNLNIQVDINEYLSNIDIRTTNSLMNEIEEHLPFNKKRKRILIKLAQLQFPQKTLISLVKSIDEPEFDRLIESIPPAFLIKNKLLKTKDHDIYTKSSIRPIIAPMRD